jgi:polysaccharide export outer membrane protein
MEGRRQYWKLILTIGVLLAIAGNLPGQPRTSPDNSKGTVPVPQDQGTAARDSAQENDREQNRVVPAGEPSQGQPTEIQPGQDPASGIIPLPDTPAATETDSKESVPMDYLIGPDDVLEIEVFQVPELKQQIRVENDGSIPVRLLGKVHAAGLTAAQLQKKLETEWGKRYLEDPHVTVFVKETKGQPVSVIGAVDKPGVLQITSQRSLIQILSTAGGLAKRGTGAPGRYLYVTRKSGFGDLEVVPGMRVVTPSQIEIDIDKLLYGREPALNIDIKPFDIVSVSKTGVVYVVGDVKRPGGFTLEDKDSISVLQALAMAEGLNIDANKKNCRIIHHKESGALAENQVDLGKILDGTAKDVSLGASDVLYVPTSRAKFISRRTAESAAAILTGVVVYRGL